MPAVDEQPEIPATENKRAARASAGSFARAKRRRPAKAESRKKKPGYYERFQMVTDGWLPTLPR